MTTPASEQTEPHARMPRRNAAAVEETPVSTEPVADPASPEPRRRQWRWKFLPAFWTIASAISLTVNIILIIILLLMWQMLDQIRTLQSYGMGEASGLLGGLYTNFVKMDQASIRTNIHVEKDIPVQFSLNVSGPTNVTLSQPVTIRGATVNVSTGGLNIRDANATIVLPAGVVLPINIENLVVPVDQKVPAVLDVPVDIPLNQTELHEPFVGLQKVVEPWYCLVEPNATVNGMQVCTGATNQTTNPATDATTDPTLTDPALRNPTPITTVIP